MFIERVASNDVDGECFVDSVIELLNLSKRRSNVYRFDGMLATCKSRLGSFEPSCFYNLHDVHYECLNEYQI